TTSWSRFTCARDRSRWYGVASTLSSGRRQKICQCSPTGSRYVASACPPSRATRSASSLTSRGGSGSRMSERRLDAGERKHVGAKPVPVERHDRVDERDHRVVPETHPAADRGVVVVGPAVLDAEERGHEGVPRPGVDPLRVEEAGRLDPPE